MNYEDKLNATLVKLERATQRTIKTRGYSKDVQNLKNLVESIKEQLIHANTRSASRTQR